MDCLAEGENSSEMLIIVSQTAIPFLIGTKYDTFATFPRDEQEEITKQVYLLSSCSAKSPDAFSSGQAVRKGDAFVADILLDFGVHKCAEDFQDRPCQGFRPEMCYSRD
jgi:hypothetical protein